MKDRKLQTRTLAGDAAGIEAAAKLSSRWSKESGNTMEVR